VGKTKGLFERFWNECLGEGRGWEEAIARFWKGLQLGKGMTVGLLDMCVCLGSSGRSALCFLFK
jgi:hypothetical protein